MCGLTGIVNTASPISQETLGRMTDSLVHRGPDSRGTQVISLRAGGQVGFGHRRLSILDLSDAGHQPMNRGHLTVVFNGEIYNYREIQIELVRLGHHFESDSDTEVILAAIQQWGTYEAVKKFNGMYAIAIFDRTQETLQLVRDRAGVKPLYYSTSEKLLLFASELKAFRANPEFKAELCDDAIESYFRYGYLPGSNSIYQSVAKVQPGTIVTFNLKNLSTPSEKKYWDLFHSFNQPKLDLNFSDATEELDRLFQSAFSYRMVSDVPVGVFLSGGYDSSVVAAVIQSQQSNRIKTFTIGFEDKDFDESTSARAIAEHLGTDHHEETCTEKQAQSIIPRLSHFFDEPFADASAIPTILVSQLAEKTVKVALSADAGDELFAGYNKYARIMQFMERYRNFPSPLKSRLLFKILCRIPTPKDFGKRTLDQLHTLSLHGVKPNALLKNAGQVFSSRQLEKLLCFIPRDYPTTFDQLEGLGDGCSSQLDQLLALDYKTYLTDDILTKVDRATMSVSLEGREPLLDYRIAEYAAQLPREYKYAGGIRKRILKEVAKKYLPESLLDRPKKGFSVPYFRWLRGDLKFLLDDYLSKPKLEQAGILNPKFVKNYLDRFHEGDPRTNVGTWTLLMFQMWHEHWMENKAPIT